MNLLENQTTLALNRNKKIALVGAFSALIIVLTVTRLGFIAFSPTISITILQIPVILCAMMTGVSDAIFSGFVMGLMSLIMASMSPTGILDPLFVNPLCSVLPRMLLGVVTWILWTLLNFIPKMPKSVAAGISGFIATCAHTFMVYGCIFIFDGTGIRAALEKIGMAGTGYFGVILVGLPSEILEAVASLVVCALVYAALFFAGKKKSKLSQQ